MNDIVKIHVPLSGTSLTLTFFPFHQKSKDQQNIDLIAVSANS